MIAHRGMNIAELDHRASTAEAPYVIITADCSNPKEIDDGVFVQPLPTAQETYRVGVCVVDASGLYTYPEIRAEALEKTEAKYWQLPGGEQGYDPMIDPDVVKQRDFTEGNIRDALVVSFIVGRGLPPGDVSIDFGKVEVRENIDYRELWRRCLPGKCQQDFGRASAFIIQYLGYNSGGDYDEDDRSTTEQGDIYADLIDGSGGLWLKGSRINESYMVAANHLVGRVMATEGRPAIYRVHDPADETFMEFIPSNVARYSRTPGIHTGLNLDPYCRVTSPLRRLEDFMMSYQLKKRAQGQPVTLRDMTDIADAVGRLNRRVTQEVARVSSQLSRRDILGQNYQQAIPGQGDGRLVLLRSPSDKAEIAS